MDLRTHSIVEGLDYVGTGKKGSETCPDELIERILSDARINPPPKPTLGAFFGGLWMKGVAPEERAFAALLGPLAEVASGADSGSGSDALASESSLLKYFSEGVAPRTVELARQLLGGKILSYAEARELGDFWFAPGTDPVPTAGDGLRTLTATIMRVRYANPDEYAGILSALEGHFPPEFCEPTPPGAPIIQLAEPFDGVERSHIITPLIMKELGSMGFRVVAVCGRNPGPKRGHNLLDLAEALGGRFLRSNLDLAEEPSPSGWYLRQAEVAPALDRWVELRRQMVKRPGLATLEKYVSPFRADFFIGSAFHHNFNEKMIEIGERVGFKNVVVTFKTVEGSLAPSLARPTKISYSKEGSLIEATFAPADFGLPSMPDPKPALATNTPLASNTNAALAENVALVERYARTGSSGDAYFDARVKMAVSMYRAILFR